MLIKETQKQTELTRKAIEYYIKQGLINPEIQENGYREFTQKDISCLKQIAVLRKLNLSLSEIKQFLNESKKEVLHKFLLKKSVQLNNEKRRQELFKNLIDEDNWENTKIELNKIDNNETILNRLLFMFPGYYGRFICMHFAPYLNDRIITKEQEVAYTKIIEFLDSVPTLEFTPDLQKFFEENTQEISSEAIKELNCKNKKAIENPDKFLTENKEVLETYLEYKKSDEYKNSPATKIMDLMKKFNETSGYYNIFLPAMRILSPKYNRYYEKLLVANERLLEIYPEIKELNED